MHCGQSLPCCPLNNARWEVFIPIGKVLLQETHIVLKTKLGSYRFCRFGGQQGRQGITALLEEDQVAFTYWNKKKSRRIWLSVASESQAFGLVRMGGGVGCGW